MNEDKEYVHVLEHLYEKSLVLHDQSLWDPVLYFYFIDALAHIDYTVGLLAYTYQSPKNIMAGQYLRWRIDEEKKGDRAKFPAFINWLKVNHPGIFDDLPSLWRKIYDDGDPASYISFRIVLDRDNRDAIRPHVFFMMIEEFFKQDFLKSLYEDASLATRFAEFKRCS
ncbi:MAG TPA: hypothetical protein PLK36_02190 [Methanoregulaceae archaeon]|nr:hypothetical protein [Methanoregulaceae archaeon]HQN88865.1 hypothetical protein [Methanoregulaceae archaeon]